MYMYIFCFWMKLSGGNKVPLWDIQLSWEVVSKKNELSKSEVARWKSSLWQDQLYQSSLRMYS